MTKEPPKKMVSYLFDVPWVKAHNVSKEFEEFLKSLNVGYWSFNYWIPGMSLSFDRKLSEEELKIVKEKLKEFLRKLADEVELVDVREKNLSK